MEKYPRTEINRLNREAEIRDIIPDWQAFYYLNGECTVRSEEIEFGDMIDMVWESKVIRSKFRRVKIFDRIGKDADGHFYFNLTKGGRCEFLQYIINASNLEVA